MRGLHDRQPAGKMGEYSLSSAPPPIQVLRSAVFDLHSQDFGPLRHIRGGPGFDLVIEGFQSDLSPVSQESRESIDYGVQGSTYPIDGIPGPRMCQCICGVTPGAPALART